MTYRRTTFDDPFDTPRDPAGGVDLYIDPVALFTLVAVILLLLFLGYAAWDFGRRQGRRKVEGGLNGSATAIYEIIDYHLQKALTAPGMQILDRARMLVDVIDARLGLVMAVSSRYGKLTDTLKKALAGPVEIKPEEAPKSKVPMGTEEQRLKVWEALQSLHAFWKDRDAVMAMIGAAQLELTTVVREKKPEPKPVAKAAEKPVEKKTAARNTKKNTGGNKPGLAAKADAPPATADKSEPAAQVVAAPAVTVETPTPPPPKPTAPGGKRTKNVARHKKSMLA